jgi:hypothetical protein
MDIKTTRGTFTPGGTTEGISWARAASATPNTIEATYAQRSELRDVSDGIMVICK